MTQNTERQAYLAGTCSAHYHAALLFLVLPLAPATDRRDARRAVRIQPNIPVDYENYTDMQIAAIGGGRLLLTQGASIMVDILAALWRRKLWIIATTVLFAIASVAYSLSLPNVYRSSTVLAPTDSGDRQSLGSIASRFGDLGRVAGFDLGGTTIQKSVIAIEMMNSWDFSDSFIKKHNLEAKIHAARDWDENSGQTQFDENIYNASTEQWLTDSDGNSMRPTSWKLHERFTELLGVNKDPDTGLITVSFDHYSPELAAEIAGLVVDEVNLRIRQTDMAESEKNIAFLNSQIDSTPQSELRSVFYGLLEEQMKSYMLARANEEYALKTVTRQMIPERKVRPKRAIICLFGTLFGGLLASLIVLVRSFLSDPLRRIFSS